MNLKEIQIRDPFVLIAEGKYYLFGSTDTNIWRDNPGVGFDCHCSTDLLEWTGPFEAFRPPQGFWGTRNFWAPEVFEYEGCYYMFASFIGEHYKRGTAILKATHPQGPFEPWSNGAVTPKEWMCLDGTLYIDDTGSPWMVFCHEWVEIGDGTICAIPLSVNLKEAISKPIELFASTDAHWSRTVTSKSFGMTGYVTDGCFLHRLKNNMLLMLWSCIGEKGYCLGYAVSENGSLLGPWHQGKEPLFSEDGGHGMIFKTVEGRLMLAIHTPNDTPNERAAFFELEETGAGVRLVK